MIISWRPGCTPSARSGSNDIGIAEEFVAEFGEVPRIPAFKRLAIIYERQDRYEEALAVCDQALDIGTTDGTKGGFEGRKERLRKKMND